MPDSALEDTEVQFFELLDAAAGDLPIHIQLYSLPEIARADRAHHHISKFYSGFDGFWNSRFDGVIITGTEPRKPELRDEPYWSVLCQTMDWAERNTASTVLSCLAAHAGVLYKDGVGRHAKRDKLFGLYEDEKASDHALTDGIGGPMPFPHSRWNELREAELVACGYQVLTRSREAGANMFAKKWGRSLFVHFQGHPEYAAQTLLKEYRRDIGRFLRGERDTYPEMPKGYFDESATKILAAYRRVALHDPREQRLAEFPEAAALGGLGNAWRSSATLIYRNWIQYLAAMKMDARTSKPVAQVSSGRWSRAAKAV
jgi:homoserine O-succinyltransferase/O-acetyltransferase